MSKRALIFDFDGLILDTEWPEYESWRKVFKDHGLTLSIQDWMHVVGGPTIADFKVSLEKTLGRKLNWMVIDAARTEHYKQISEGLQILPGVRELMVAGASKGWRIGVASSSPHAWVWGHLRKQGLDSWVEILRTRDNCKNLKPHPEPYRLACKDLGADPAKSLAFEDSAPGVASAKAAGLTVVAVPNRITKHHDLDAADIKLASLDKFVLPA